MTNYEKINQVKNIVFQYYGSNNNYKSNKREDTMPRQIAHYLCRKYNYGSLAMIGSIIGSKNHATVLYSERVIKDQLTYDKLLKQQITELSSYCSGFRNYKRKEVKNGITYVFHSKNYNSRIL